MEIRNEIDAKFILKHRAKVLVYEHYKKMKLIWTLIVPFIPLVLLVICVDTLNPNTGNTVQDSPTWIGYALIILLLCTAIPALVLSWRYDKDVDKITNRLLEEEKKKGTIDIEKK